MHLEEVTEESEYDELVNPFDSSHSCDTYISRRRRYKKVSMCYDIGWITERENMHLSQLPKGGDCSMAKHRVLQRCFLRSWLDDKTKKDGTEHETKMIFDCYH